MNSYEEKISLLSEMITFALVDGELHPEEINLLRYISEELEISKPDFMSLFFEPKESAVLKDQFSRILHFYQLALIMHVDNRLHRNEKIAIKDIGIRMGLSPIATKSVLELMENSVDKEVPIDVLISIFQHQDN
jgi:ATP-dependent protease Clp ATPase subunit